MSEHLADHLAVCGKPDPWNNPGLVRIFTAVPVFLASGDKIILKIRIPGIPCRANYAISSGSQCCSSNRPYLLTREMVSSLAENTETITAITTSSCIWSSIFMNFQSAMKETVENWSTSTFSQGMSWHVMAYRSLGFRRHSPRSFWKQPVFTSPQPKTCQLLVPELIFGRCNMGQPNCMSMSNFFMSMVHICRVATNFCRNKQNTICPYALALTPILNLLVCTSLVFCTVKSEG